MIQRTIVTESGNTTLTHQALQGAHTGDKKLQQRSGTFSKTSRREIREGVGTKAPLQGDMSYLVIGGKRKRLGEIEKL